MKLGSYILNKILFIEKKKKKKVIHQVKH